MDTFCPKRSLAAFADGRFAAFRGGERTIKKSQAKRTI
jgi:hypothetical protein